MSGRTADGDGTGDGDAGEMTLAFELSAIRRFADPAAVFADARAWSRHVGVVANDADAVAAFVDEHDLRQDFDLGDDDKWLAMQRIREETHTPRHVFVGAGPEDRRIADHLGWEYRTVPEVAEKADWERGTGSDSSGLVSRLRARLADSPLWPR